MLAGRWFSPGTPVSSTNKNDHHDITEILLKVALNTINLNHQMNERLPNMTHNEILLDVSVSWKNIYNKYLILIKIVCKNYLLIQTLKSFILISSKVPLTAIPAQLIRTSTGPCLFSAYKWIKHNSKVNMDIHWSMLVFCL